MALSCAKEEMDDKFTSFAKLLLKAFILVVSTIFLITLKKKLLTPETTLFLVASFCVLATLIFAIVGLVDGYVFNNLAVGMGIAIGMQIMNY